MNCDANCMGQHPRPFRLVSDPDLSIYEKYGVEHVWYGRDTSDHIPMKLISRFINR